MTWNAEIALKSGRIIVVKDLKSIIWKNKTDGSLFRIDDFENFILPKERLMSFIGELDTVSLNSAEIEYLSLHQFR